MTDPPRIATRSTPLWQPTPVDFITTYKIVYRCKHCGREWSKTETEDLEVDRQVAGPEVPSAADVAMEEERYDEED